MQNGEQRHAGEIRNPKSEIGGKSQIRNPNFQSKIQDLPASIRNPQFAIRNRLSAFTLIELLVVIGIIILLIGILLPVISKVKNAAYAAHTQQFINELESAVDRYHSDFRAYPGPLSNADICIANDGAGSTTLSNGIVIKAASQSTAFDITNLDNTKITGMENCVLGLLGGLTPSQPGTGAFTANTVYYDPTLVGQGPQSIAPMGGAGALPKRFQPYADTKNLSWRTPANVQTGQFADDAGSATDTIIPEFVDEYPDPMPILYLRAKLGVSTSGTTAGDNPIITAPSGDTDGSGGGPIIPAPPPAVTGSDTRSGAYDISQIIGYTGPDSSGRYIGVGKTIKTSAYKDATGAAAPPAGNILSNGLNKVQATIPYSASQQFAQTYPYDCVPYLTNPNGGGARSKDSYILISAGPDRTYGTNDDIASFGEIVHQ